jgi:hypothetical protein
VRAESSKRRAPAAKRTTANSGKFLLLGAAAVCTLAGVFLNFVVFPPTVTGAPQWLSLGVLLTVFMLGIGFAARFAGTDAPTNFSAFDLIFFLSQGALWPATWPSLAALIGTPPVFTPNVTPSPSPSMLPSPTAVVDLLHHTQHLAQLLASALGVA